MSFYIEQIEKRLRLAEIALEGIRTVVDRDANVDDIDQILSNWETLRS